MKKCEGFVSHLIINYTLSQFFIKLLTFSGECDILIQQSKRLYRSSPVVANDYRPAATSFYFMINIPRSLFILSLRLRTPQHKNIKQYVSNVVEVRISLTQELSCNLCSPPWEWATRVHSPRSLMQTKEGARVRSSSILGEKNEKMRRFRLAFNYKLYTFLVFYQTIDFFGGM